MDGADGPIHISSNAKAKPLRAKAPLWHASSPAPLGPGDLGCAHCVGAAPCAARGLLLLHRSVYETLRFIPPLTVAPAEVDEVCDVFDAALAEVVA